MRKKRFFIVLLVVLSINMLFAQNMDYKSLLNNVDKSQVSQMVKLLKESGQISAEDAQKALDQLKKMKKDDFDVLKNKGLAKIESQKDPIKSERSRIVSSLKKDDQVSMPSPLQEQGPQPQESKKDEEISKMLSEEEKLQESLNYLNN